MSNLILEEVDIKNMSNKITTVYDDSFAGVTRIKIGFENKRVISVVKGEGTYGTEMAVFNKDGELTDELFLSTDYGDNVIGWITQEKLELYIKIVGEAE